VLLVLFKCRCDLQTQTKQAADAYSILQLEAKCPTGYIVQTIIFASFPLVNAQSF